MDEHSGWQYSDGYGDGLEYCFGYIRGNGFGNAWGSGDGIEFGNNGDGEGGTSYGTFTIGNPDTKGFRYG